MEEALNTEATIRQLSELPDADNRRRHPRYAVELNVSLSSEHNFYAGFVENLSNGGVFVATHSLKAVGTVFEVLISLPGSDEPVRARGEVRWVREYGDHSDVPPGVGIRFLELDAAGLARIEAFLAHREPLFFDDE
ncbi:MAG: TIGR02266 family protein [Polyangiaceae bacterium]|nr:TIGR02266 family protein [Polyangiaceae bacterium]